MEASQETTPYDEAIRIPEEKIRYKGQAFQWDEDHNFSYYITNALAKSKYQHLIDKGILSEWDKEEYMEDIEEYEEDTEEYKYLVAQIPWREQHYEFNFSWGWCLDKEKGAYCIPVDADAITAWAGIEKDDLIREVP